MKKTRTVCEGCRSGENLDFAISMAFQPIMDLTTSQPFAYEALVRGPLGQSAASVLDQVTPANRYAFDQRCRVTAIRTAAKAGLLNTPARLSINFLPNAVYEPRACIKLTLATAAEVSFPADRLIGAVRQTLIRLQIWPLGQNGAALETDFVQAPPVPG